MLITRRRLFEGGLLAFFASLLPGKSKANEVHSDRPDIQCGDRLQVVGLRGLGLWNWNDPFDGVVVGIDIRQSIGRAGSSREYISYDLIAADCFPPTNWAYPEGGSWYLRFEHGRWTDGVHNNSVSVKFHNETWSDTILRNKPEKQ